MASSTEKDSLGITTITETQPASSSSEAVQQSEEPAAKSLTLKVIDQNGNEIFFKINKTTPLNKLCSAYCERSGIDTKTVRFLYDGQRIKDGDTAGSLEMEDNAIISAMFQQIGG